MSDCISILNAIDLLRVKQSLNREDRKALTYQLDILAFHKYMEINKINPKPTK